MRRGTWFLLTLSVAACASTTDGSITRDEARQMSGRADGADVCQSEGWYDDVICDEFCTRPDPACRATCSSDLECRQILCARAPCPVNRCIDGMCEVTATAVGQACGTRGHEPCPTGQYCSWPAEAICGAADAPGTCETIPDVCPKNISPVCGCNGEEYDNACFASLAGVSIANDGTCSTPATGATTGAACGGRGHEPCAEGQFCEWQPSGMCGASDQPGRCQTRPDACTAEFSPVCGCDDQQHANPCNAQALGISVRNYGPCALFL